MIRSRLSKTLLIKTLVFIIVLFVIAFEVIPSLPLLSRKKNIDQATELVCGKILLTRQKAIASGTCYRIRYDFATGECTTYRESSPGRWTPEFPAGGQIPPGVAISPTSTPSNGYIEINENGVIENHGVPVVIRLVDGKGTQKSIRISPAGMVQEIPTW